MYLFTWSGLVSIPNFPLKKRKKSLRFKVIFESIWIFLSGWKKKMTESWGHMASKWFFFSGLKAKFWAPLGGFFYVVLYFVGLFVFFLRDLGRVNDLIFEQAIWVVSYCWHIAQESKQTQMCCKHREGEKHHYLGKSQCLKLDLLGQKCDFDCVNPDGEEWNLKNSAFNLLASLCPWSGKGFCALRCEFGSLWKILGAVALF